MISFNRLLANALRIPLANVVDGYVQKPQRGFLTGRKILDNVLDIDAEMAEISHGYLAGAAIFFDFAAAFPSVAHDYLWEAVLAIGIPSEVVDLYKIFYRGNTHILRHSEGTTEGPTVGSGV